MKSQEFKSYFLEYLRSTGTAVDDIETYESLDGVKSLPARYDLGGVKKTVLVPLDLLTLDVRDRIEESKTATERANQAASSAEVASARAERAADDADTAREGLEQIKADATEATDAANRAANRAELAAVRAENDMADFSAQEQARQEAEAVRQNNEMQRQTAFETFKEVGDRLKQHLDNPPLIKGDPATWWLWNEKEARYVDSGYPASGRSPYIEEDTLEWKQWNDVKGEYEGTGVYAGTEWEDVTEEDFLNAFKVDEQEGEDIKI